MRYRDSLSIPTPQIAYSNIISFQGVLSNILLVLIFISLTFKFQLRIPTEGYYATLANLLIIILGILFIIFKLCFKNTQINTRLDFPFLLFSIAIIIGLTHGALSIGFNSDYLSDMRTFMQFFLFFIVTSLRFNRKDFSKFLIRLSIVIIISAITVSVYSVLTSIFNFEHPLDIGNPWPFGEQDIGNVERSAGLIPNSVLLITPVILISLHYLKKLSIWQFVGLFLLNLMGILFTFTRSTWLGVIISILLFFILTRQRVWKILALMIVVVLLLNTILASFHLDLFDLINQRTGLIFTESPDRIGSLQHRIEESKAFLELFLKNPGFGDGLGATVGFYSLALNNYGERSSWHNAYPMLLGKLGIFGFLGFLFILLRVFCESLYILRHDPNRTNKILIKTFLSIFVTVIVTTFSISTLISFDFTILFVTLSAIIAIYGHYLRESLKK